LPSICRVEWYAGKSGRVFQETNQAGEERVYAVLPIVSGVGYAMSVWPKNSPMLKAGAMNPVKLCCSDRDVLGSPLSSRFWALNRLANQTYSQLWPTNAPFSR